jgi:hypothetical protein
MNPLLLSWEGVPRVLIWPFVTPLQIFSTCHVENNTGIEYVPFRLPEKCHFLYGYLNI